MFMMCFELCTLTDKSEVMYYYVFISYISLLVHLKFVRGLLNQGHKNVL